jgi:hypothetical protein
MSVDHTITSGIGYIVEIDEDLLIERYEEDPDMYFREVLAESPDIDYLIGGSYYGHDPIEYAIVVKGTGFSVTDLAGIRAGDSPVLDGVRKDAARQLDDAYRKIMGKAPADAPRFLVAGLWH